MKILNICKDLENLTKVSYDLDALNLASETNAKNLVKTSEKIYRDQVKEIASSIASKNIKMVLVAGPSSSGKTTTSNIISQELLKKHIGSIVVSIDDFFVNLEDTPLLPNGEPDFENITSVDCKAFNSFFTDLLTKQTAKMPHFNFFKHKRDGWEQVSINKGDVLIVEGIHALNPMLIQTHTFEANTYRVYAFTNSVFTLKNKIVLEPQGLRLMRRCYRDAFSRGREPIYTLNNWNNVCEGEKLYIAPYMCNADSIIDTAHPYEVLIYAQYLTKLLVPYRNNPLAKKLLSILTKLKPLDKKFVPANSLLWEFIKE